MPTPRAAYEPFALRSLFRFFGLFRRAASFSIFKRGMRGIYQHCGEAHLHRYLAEFDFRYNNCKIRDKERRIRALEGIEGKRLTYLRSH